MLSAEETLQLAALCSPGELRSLAELLDEVKDGEDKEDREDAPVRRRESRRLRALALPHKLLSFGSHECAASANRS